MRRATSALAVAALVLFGTAVHCAETTEEPTTSSTPISEPMITTKNGDILIESPVRLRRDCAAAAVVVAAAERSLVPCGCTDARLLCCLGVCRVASALG